MTMKRLLASVLALLLMVSLLPIGVMADTVVNNPKGNTVPEIASGDTMINNSGTVTTNNLIAGDVEAGTEKNLDEIAKGVNNSGYRMTGYTAYYREDGKDIEITEGTNSGLIFLP